MIAEAASRPKDAPMLGFLDETLENHMTSWLKVCNGFMLWHRTKWLPGETTAEENQQTERALLWLIRGSRAMQALVFDPEFPRKDLASDLEIALWQLEQAWAARHNPMTEVEADKIIADFFPPHAS